MRFSTVTTLSILSAALVSANSHVSPPHRRHLEKTNIAGRYVAEIERRAGGPISNDTQDAISGTDTASTSDQSSTSTTSSAVSSSAGSESGAAGDIITPSTTSSASSTTTTAQTTVDTDTVVTSATQDQAVTPSSASSSAIISSASPSSIVDTAPETILVSSASARQNSTVVRTPQSVVTATRTASSSSTASVGLANDEATKKIGSLSMTAFIAIIVVASVVGLGAVGVFVFRKWKLRPSNRFDRRMKPIDFSPHNDGMTDDFLEKTLHRSGSRSSADMQRQQFVKDLETDPNYVAGVPEHDFTAVSNHAGYGTYGDETYHHDPFAHAQAYEYDPGYYGHDAHGYPPAPAGHQHVDYRSHEYPTQDQPTEGYADLQRGNSNGSDHAPRQQVYPNDFPSPDNYIGRPTGGADGPYAQAAQYRGY